MKNSLPILLLLCLVSLGFSTENYLFEKELTPTAATSAKIGSVELDQDIYAHTALNFANLRLISKGVEIPFALRPVTTRDTTSTTVHTALKKMSFTKSGTTLEVIYQLDQDDSVPEHLTIMTGIKDFEKRVSLRGSNDQKQWNTLVDRGLIYDYSTYIDLRQTTLSFEAPRYRFYKLLIEDVVQLQASQLAHIIETTRGNEIVEVSKSYLQREKILDLKEVRFHATLKKQVYSNPRIQDSRLTLTHVEHDSLAHTTILTLRSSRQPLDSLIFATENTNFSRALTVEALDSISGQIHPRRVGSTTLYKVEADTFQKSNMALRLATTTRAQWYVVTIDNKDNPPLGIDSVQARGPIHELIYFTGGATTMKLRYGGVGRVVPQYDVSSVLATLPPVSGSRWNLANERALDGVIDEAPKAPFLNSSTVLSGVIVILVLTLGFALWTSVNKMGSLNL